MLAKLSKFSIIIIKHWQVGFYFYYLFASSFFSSFQNLQFFFEKKILSYQMSEIIVGEKEIAKF